MLDNNNYLYQKLNAAKDFIKSGDIAIPKYISDNLKYPFFDWQKAAFENLLMNESNPKYKKDPTHLMFNMATGTGKTLLMAATLLYYYKQGYKHFIFFVNQNNIVDKTENNFIDSNHNKYLFKPTIVIDDKTVNIEQVDVFSDEPQSIEIKFTTIQKLYNDIHIEKENQTTLEDLRNKNIVMFADEAHSLNTLTKDKKNEQMALGLEEELKDNASKRDIERKGWEHTVRNLILNKNGQSENNKNVLLEFTATIPSVIAVVEKYKPITVAKFDLKPFMLSGYTKQINLISSTLDKKQRILQALVFNWYRHKIALKNSIANFKPVILFRSKTIDESKQDYEDFVDWISGVNASDFNFLKTVSQAINNSRKVYEQGQSRTNDVLKFIKDNGIKYSEIAGWIKDNFQEKNIIITNSKDNDAQKEKTTEKQEKLLNNLEDKNNHIRAIFTVKRLTEGWDVLNLFDIVRLYQGQNSGGKTERSGNTPEATTQEKQLIGRGVRYCHFNYLDKPSNKRKFDNDPNNELRILEELFYYTYDEESKYISHLVKELKSDGYLPDPDDRVFKTFNLKSEFKNSDFYKNTLIWHNDREDNPNRKKKDLEEVGRVFENKLFTININEEVVNSTGGAHKQNIVSQKNETTRIKLKNIGKHIFKKALNIKAKQDNTLFQFSKLKDELEILSTDDLLKDEFLGDFSIDFIHSAEITNKDKLNAILKFLDQIFNELNNNLNPKIGSEFKSKKFDYFFNGPKTKSIKQEDEGNSVAENDWYVLDGFAGTSEEKALIKFVENTIGNLKKKYEEIHLLRNEEVYKIYDFAQGRGFQPDFLLFLKEKQQKSYYQVFIEPKGGHLADGERWKEKFLQEIKEKYGPNNNVLDVLGENENYYLIGLPFFNAQNNSQFKTDFDTDILSDNPKTIRKSLKRGFTI